MITVELTKEEMPKEIQNARKEIKTDYIQFSIGEVINLYKSGDLNLSPAYQRLFRWTNSQKSKFIESIILGIPIPSLFVAQHTNGKWDVIDGLQRISTILQFTGN